MSEQAIKVLVCHNHIVFNENKTTIEYKCAKCNTSHAENSFNVLSRNEHCKQCFIDKMTVFIEKNWDNLQRINKLGDMIKDSDEQ